MRALLVVLPLLASTVRGGMELEFRNRKIVHLSCVENVP